MVQHSQHGFFSLLVITVLLFATQFSSAEQLFTTTSFRHSVSERLLESMFYDINCAGSCYNKEFLNNTEMTYRFVMGPNSQANLGFDYDEGKLMILYFDFDLNLPLDFAVNVSSNKLSTETPAIQADSQLGFLPITLSQSDKNELLIRLLNPDQNNTATISVQIIYIDKALESVTPLWVVPFAAVGGMAFVLLLVLPVCWLKYCNNRRSQVNPLSSDQRQAAKTDIESRFPETKFEDLKSSFSQKTCSICLEDLEESQLCRQFGCQHIFHSKCVKPWFDSELQEKRKVACPNCKQDLILVKQIK